MDSRLSTHLKVRHFALIDAIANHGTMHRAAKALHMTQSTASKMLADVEALLDAQLFVREARGMTTTLLGDYALSVARKQLSGIGRFAEEFAARRDGGYGTLSVGAIMGAAPDIVAHAVADIKRTRPLLTVQLIGETSDHILDMLEAGKLDMAVGRFNSPRHHRLFKFEPLAEEPLALVARANHSLTSNFNGDINILIDSPWVLQPRTTPTRKVLDKIFADSGIEAPANMVECVSIFAILHLVQVSDAVAVLPVSVVNAHLRAGLLEELPMRPAVSVSGFGLVTRKKEKISDIANLFANFLRNYAQKVI